MNYYNEMNPEAAAWLRALIAVGAIPYGDVDERDIQDVTPAELAGYTQCHFFAGIGGWPLALAIAGVPSTRRLWTGSCPCQPFSTAGEGAGFDDERHVWPAWQWLIEKCRPPTILGEQVASKPAELWIDLVQADLEGLGYAFGCVAFPAASVRAPHIRDRAYWVGHRIGAGLEGFGRGHQAEIGQREGSLRSITPAGQPCGLAYNHIDGCAAVPGAGLLHPQHHLEPCGHPHRVADSVGGGLAGPSGRSSAQELRVAQCSVPGWPHATHGGWQDVDWLFCRDGKWRCVEPGAFPLADGLPARVGRLRGYGNAIVPQQAAAFIRSVL